MLADLIGRWTWALPPRPSPSPLAGVSPSLTCASPAPPAPTSGSWCTLRCPVGEGLVWAWGAGPAALSCGHFYLEGHGFATSFRWGEVARSSEGCWGSRGLGLWCLAVPFHLHRAFSINICFSHLVAGVCGGREGCHLAWGEHCFGERAVVRRWVWVEWSRVL